jgi:hypothetical protein
MRGFLSMEEYYFQDLQWYYDSLQMGLDWDYYSGRNDPDLTLWLGYFVDMMARAADAVRDRALTLQDINCRPATPWDELSRRQQQLLSRLVVARGNTVTTPSFTAGDIVEWFAVSKPTAHVWLAEWHTEGFVEPASGHERIRAWKLRDDLDSLVSAQLSAPADG